MDGSCHYCGTTKGDLRPYGPGGSSVCFPCVKNSPEREKVAREEFLRQLDAAGSVVELTPNGPKDFNRRRLN